MSLLSRALQILRTHGVRGLMNRGVAKTRRLIDSNIRARSRRLAWNRFVSQVRVGPVYFPHHANPHVSIVVRATKPAHLASCLNAVLRQLDSMPLEVIVVHDGSMNEIASYLDECSGIKVVVAKNEGAAAVLSAAAAARAPFVHFLGERTIVTPGWLAPLLQTFDDESVGAVASQLRAPNDTIEQAGGVVWRTGETSWYGVGERPSHPGLAFPRDIDFGIIISLMVRASALAALAPALADVPIPLDFSLELCFLLRNRGMRVIYQPASIIVHFREGGAIPIQHDRVRFLQSWQDELAQHFPHDELLIERAARRIAGRKTVLVMDSFVSFADRSAGARRMLAIMLLMRKAGWHVIFVAHDGGTYEPYTARARQYGIEVLPHRGDATATLRSISIPIDVAWIARPDVLIRYLSTLRAVIQAPIVYDTVDLHFLRRLREQSVRGEMTQWEATQSVEIDLARKANVTVVTSAHEAELLAAEGITAKIVPIVERRVAWRSAFSGRRDILFLGNYSHNPNVDGTKWFVETILPIVRAKIPDARVLLAGADPTPAIERMAQPGVDVLGFVPDIERVFNAARIFVAPLRFGAGMKGKIVQSFAHGLPVVTTSVGAEGIGIEDGIHAIVRDEPEAFADAVVQLYNNEPLWSKMSQAGYALAERFEPLVVAAAVEEALQDALEHEERVRIHFGTSTHTA